MKCMLGCGFYLITVVQVSRLAQSKATSCEKVRSIFSPEQPEPECVIAWAGHLAARPITARPQSPRPMRRGPSGQLQWALDWAPCILANTRTWRQGSSGSMPQNIHSHMGAEKTNFKMQTLNPLQRLKDTGDVKALVMHSVCVWGCENVPMAGRERALTIQR